MHTTPTTLILPARAVELIVRYYGADEILGRLVERLEGTMSTYAPERSVTPARSGFHYLHPRPGLVEWMPIHELGRDVTIKVVGYHPENPAAYRLPTIVSTISAYDTATGHLSCLMDGVLPTAMRTAAATVVASRHLARPDSQCLGLIGCGAQAVAHAHALSRYFPLKTILAYDTDPVAAASLADRCRAFGLDVPVSTSPIATVVARADILVTATSIDIGAGPLFDAGLCHQPHLHINAIGSDFPGKTELPLPWLRRAYVCPDFPVQARIEGECQQLRPEEIGENIVAVCKQPAAYTHLRDALTVYDSTGWSLQDQVVLRLFAERAEALGLGQRIEIENMAGQANNPYDFLTSAAPPSPAVSHSHPHPHELPA
ncbi:ornithine cyclodeaminase/alanine dehydrogenase-like protein (mu-crystallin family) [Lewinella marina]|nr:ornithine cyclodeaminase family protein [Neolewinella marina]NJB85989.1 ornithine cyclodeaminase/alanine dehydrogenase-like protein (mu-crystallin family) [Neolewinella marina]